MIPICFTDIVSQALFVFGVILGEQLELSMQHIDVGSVSRWIDSGCPVAVVDDAYFPKMFACLKSFDNLFCASDRLDGGLTRTATDEIEILFLI